MTSEKRPIYIAAVFLCIGIVCTLYGLFGPTIIRAGYEGRLIGVLNKVITGQAGYPVSYYITIANTLFIGGCSVISLFFIFYFIFQRYRSWPALDRSIASLGLAALLLLLALIVERIVNAPSNFWNSGNLSWALSPFYNYHLYYYGNEGPLLCSLYGPITALVYSPAVVFKTPTLAIQSAMFIAMCWYFLPALAIFLNRYISGRKLFMVVLSSFALFGLITFSRDSLLDLLPIRPDSPGLGLSALACLSLYYSYQKYADKKNLPLFISALLSVLAVWTKQTFFPLLIALPIYVLLVYNFRLFRRYILYIITSGLLVTSIILCMVNPRDLFFSMFTVPFHHPWTDPNRIATLFYSFNSLIRESLPLLLVLAFLMANRFIRLVRSPISLIKLKSLCRAHIWTILLTVCLFMIPTSVLGRAKVGGASNTLGPAVYFLALSIAVLFLGNISDFSMPKTVAGRRYIKFLFLLSTIIFIYMSLHGAKTKFTRGIVRVPNNIEDIAYEYVKNHPDEAYFPNNPLSSLFAEGRLYHFTFGLVDRYIAGFTCNQEEFEAHIPKKVKLVAFPEFSKDEYIIRNYLPEFSRSRRIEELPGFIVYVDEK